MTFKKNKDYAIESKSKRTAELITSRRIIFTPDTDLKEELAKTAIQITCFDRDGKEVKRVTSTSGEVEDPENTSPQPSPNGEGAGQTEGGDSGGQGSGENGGGGTDNSGGNMD